MQLYSSRAAPTIKRKLLNAMKLLSSLMLAALVMGCGTTDTAPEPQGPVTVRYAQTQCADPWAGAGQNTDQGFEAAAKAYVQQQGIQLYSSSVTTAGAAVCAACTCPTGRVLQATVSPADVAALEALGFKR